MLFSHEEWKGDDEWHYIKAYQAFKEMYPRISTGSPLDPWRRVQGDVEGYQKAYRSIFLPKRCQKTSSAADEFKPMYADAKVPQLYKEVGYTLCYLCPLFIFIIENSTRARWIC